MRAFNTRKRQESEPVRISADSPSAPSTERADELDKLNVSSASRQHRAALATERADELDKLNVPGETRRTRQSEYAAPRRSSYLPDEAQDYKPVSRAVEESTAQILYNRAKEKVKDDAHRTGDLYSNDDTARKAELARREHNRALLDSSGDWLRRLGLGQAVDPTAGEWAQKTASGAAKTYAASLLAPAVLAEGWSAEGRTAARTGTDRRGRERFTGNPKLRSADTATLRTARTAALGKLSQTAQELNRSGAEDISRALQGAGAPTRLTVKTGAAAGQMLGDAAVSAATLGAVNPMTAMLARSFGSGVLDAKAKGLTTNRQMASGLANAATEYLSERLFSANRLYDGKGQGLVEAAVEKLTHNPKVILFARSLGGSALSEGLEEIASDILDPVAELAISGKWEAPKAGELIEDGIVGILAGSLGNGVHAGIRSLSGAGNGGRDLRTPVEQRTMRERTTGEADIYGGEQAGDRSRTQNTAGAGAEGSADGGSYSKGNRSEIPGGMRGSGEADHILRERHGGLSASGEIADNLRAYGITAHVEPAESWTRPYVAYTDASGEVHLRDDVSEDWKDMIGPHEITHVMRRTKYQPYLDFVQRTPDMLDPGTAAWTELLEHVAKHRGLAIGDMDYNNVDVLYDEVNAILYGHIAANRVPDGLRKVFRDFDAYSDELSGLHRRYEAERGAKPEAAAGDRRGEAEAPYLPYQQDTVLPELYGLARSMAEPGAARPRALEERLYYDALADALDEQAISAARAYPADAETYSLLPGAARPRGGFSARDTRAGRSSWYASNAPLPDWRPRTGYN